MKRNNKGMSLVEVIIVITILAVLGALMTMGISIATSKPAEECANKILTSMNNAKITTMGKQSIRLNYYMKDNCVYLDQVITDTAGNVNTTTTMIGSKGVVVEYQLKDGGFVTLGDSTNPLSLSFIRNSGGFNPEHTSGEYCVAIRVSKGTKVKTLELQYLTGKVTID